MMRWLVVLTAFAGGAVLAVVCAVSIKWYVVDIVIGQAGESDRSMIFWGLPIVFIGVFAGIGAVGLGVVAWNGLKQVRQETTGVD